MATKKEYSDQLHKGARASTFINSRELRRTETPAEKKLWGLLRNRQLKGRKFRRQHPLDKFVLDFYCHECKLAVELDGSIHDEPMNHQYDEMRTSDLNILGIKVIRFRNEEVMSDVDKVLRTISNHFNPAEK